MSKFQTALEVRLVDQRANTSRGTWELLQPLVYHSDLLGTIIVPKGFQTDFITMPRLPLLFDLMGDSAHQAATLHDWLYTTGNVPRDIADEILYEAVRASGLAKWRAVLMYIPVRIFGGFYYGRK
jgi:hypothetical protein